MTKKMRLKAVVKELVPSYRYREERASKES